MLSVNAPSEGLVEDGRADANRVDGGRPDVGVEASGLLVEECARSLARTLVDESRLICEAALIAASALRVLV